MSKEETAKTAAVRQRQPPREVHLPGFLIEQDIGLGDIVKRVTYAMGVTPCPGCEQRAAALNQWVHFSRRR